MSRVVEVECERQDVERVVDSWDRRPFHVLT